MVHTTYILVLTEFTGTTSPRFTGVVITGKNPIEGCLLARNFYGLTVLICIAKSWILVVESQRYVGLVRLIRIVVYKEFDTARLVYWLNNIPLPRFTILGISQVK